MSKAKLSLCVMTATLVAVMTLFFLPEPEAQVVQTTLVQQRVIRKTCMLDGEATYGQRQPLIAPVSGQVEQVYVNSGQWVKKDQLLLRMSTEMEEKMLTQLQMQQQQLEKQLMRMSGQQISDTDLLMNLVNQQQSLLSSIAMKQIRAAGDGRIENMYVKAGDYLSAAGVAGIVSGKEQKVTAMWIEQDGAMPSPGMCAWWCDSYGNKLEPLILESVGTPELQNGVPVYPLVFSCVLGEESQIKIGEKSPVCMTMKEETITATVSMRAMDDQQRLWVVDQDSVRPVRVNWKVCGDQQLQLPTEFNGCAVVLDPDQLDLYDGMKLKRSEES